MISQPLNGLVIMIRISQISWYSSQPPAGGDTGRLPCRVAPSPPKIHYRLFIYLCSNANTQAYPPYLPCIFHVPPCMASASQKPSASSNSWCKNTYKDSFKLQQAYSALPNYDNTSLQGSHTLLGFTSYRYRFESALHPRSFHTNLNP